MNIDPIVLSIPFFFILTGIELLVERFTHQKFYRLPDAIWILALGMLLSCDKPLPEFQGVDTQRWEQDRNACNGVRAGMRESIDKEKNKLLSLTQMQIVSLLGRPDQNELSSRNQKFFYYFIQPSSACGTRSDSLAEKLAIRFNAMGLAKEVAIVR